MPRPPLPHPTPGELEVLRVLWKRGSATVRQILEALPHDRAYTSVMSLLNVMYEKGLVSRGPEGRAFRYAACEGPERTQRSMVGDLLRRVFDGSAERLVARLLEQADPSAEELDAIHRLIEERQQGKEDECI
jgi:BlaI family transcriptional regulator, penicillinase repressor